MNEARKIVQMISENFHPLDQKEQELLSSILKEETLKKGELLLKEGDSARYLLGWKRHATAILLQRRPRSDRTFCLRKPGSSLY